MSFDDQLEEEFFDSGLSVDIPDYVYDEEQLKKGIEVEKEHSRWDTIAKKIAKDHLTLFPDYYDRLEEMEKLAKRHWSRKIRKMPKRTMEEKGIIKEFFLGGLSSGIPDTAFDLEQLKKGIKVESEHTSNFQIMKKIAKDHLMEFPDYYKRLEKMVKSAERYWTDSRYNKTKVGQFKILEEKRAMEEITTSPEFEALPKLIKKGKKKEEEEERIIIRSKEISPFLRSAVMGFL
jgi:hypothetical protein